VQRLLSVLVVLLVAACQRTRNLVEAPTTIGADPVVLRPSPELAAPGPRIEIWLDMPKGFHTAFGYDSVVGDSGTVLQTPEGRQVEFRAAVLDREWRRREMPRQAYVSGGSALQVLFDFDTTISSGRTFAGLELRASAPVTVGAVRWWSGEPLPVLVP
jgi:hypothetical protein